MEKMGLKCSISMVGEGSTLLIWKKGHGPVAISSWLVYHHAISAIYKCKKNIEDFIHPCYSVELFKKYMSIASSL